MTPRLTDLAWPAQTTRLTIRPAVPDDVGATWTYRKLPEAGRWLTGAPADLDTYAQTFVDRDRLADTLVIELDQNVIGDLMVRIENAWSQTEVTDHARGVQAELGWCVNPEHASHGYATESVTELLQICLVDLGLRRVTANCFAANTASSRLMERVGMRRESHTVQDALHRSGEWMDGLGYGLLAHEWRTRQPD